ncbi:MAG: HAMP domain-containing sensor histidine kinase [Dehalococcoidia bacterium]|nr:HAMP domain-containing sensor histidine kinase [Dehalococcoidia bacterium]
MLRSLRLRLALSFIFIVALAVGIAAVIAERTATREFDSYRSSVDAAYVETLVENLGDYYAAQGSWEGVESVISSVPSPGGRVQLLDAQGAAVADSSPGRGPGGPGGETGPGDGQTPGDGQGDGQGPGRGQGSTSGGETAPGDAPMGPGGQTEQRQQGAPEGAGDGDWYGGSEDTAYVAPAMGAELEASAQGQGRETESIPVLLDGERVGTLVVYSGGGTFLEQGVSDFLDRIRLALLAGGLSALAIAALLAVALVNGFTRPLRRLAVAARRIAAGDFGHRVDLTSPSEAADLALSFNQMAAALESDRETRRRLLADIAHELRSPLAVIQGTAQGFIDGVIPADQEHAAVIRDEAALLSKLITDLRDIALAESGELRLERAPTDLAELARQAVTRALPQAQQAGVTLDLEAQPLPAALVDRERTLQIVGNLLDNALKHTPKGGRVTVRAGASGGSVTLSVEDTGPGIAAEHLPRIFDRFYRVDAARARGSGSGLGLAIVKKLAEAQGGTVSAASEPGRGSAFTIAFPALSGL